MENRRAHNVKDKSGPKYGLQWSKYGLQWSKYGLQWSKYGLQWSNFGREQRNCVVKLKKIKF